MRTGKGILEDEVHFWHIITSNYNLENKSYEITPAIHKRHETYLQVLSEL